ncbi:dimethylmenaquinone methyltransferase [Streptomyces eurocidicus]|uniref:Dimethylmenaquinone methyltransferase n=1 Tax=Streptomyces eurocidicus TaxID=66423 RepID=A0A2N8NPP3_STREU|nr:FAD-binding and (Fe-S)-binding domain-containing protein [Streptomyces eurocidicus]MBB5119495.1 FAD/FMN-containing dehydrogenase/Fe-S oxidoreductase [Streptomyces eurocidicus]MBF6054354.1 FAD-binding protein [Streptomyces eurocidicus]PNE30747.1 dimethylmenaquinone methyltransferase [Streptomyces eurocidicus]
MPLDEGPAPSLAPALRKAVRGDVDFGAAARALVTMDASNYRRVPLGVVAPRDADDVAAALAVCREHGVPVVARGGGTSIAGQATGTGVVLDFTRHMDAIKAVDPEARTAVVQPGVVLDTLRAAAGAYGLTFGPDPSTHGRCTLGGMIGNNACGSHSVAWGTTADNVHGLDVLTYGGERARLGRGLDGLPARLADGLRAFVQGDLALLRTGFPELPRRISGYALDALLPERRTDVARAFTGSEGTLGVVTEATVRLVEAPRARALAVLGYADESAAADAAPLLLPFGPLTVEGMAADLVGDAAWLPRGAAGLPRGAAWLFVETGGTGPAEARARAEEIVRAAAPGTTGHEVVTDPAGQRALWRVRDDAAGTATRLPDGGEAWPGWEDCAVPPRRLGAYLREFRALLGRYGLRGAPYGHFGDGCVHVRIDFDLTGPAGVRRFRDFSAEAAGLVVAHGGSLSGEHGDGQARAELLPVMYGPEVVALFTRFKDLWDPAGGLNPGILARPHRLDENLRFEVLPKRPVPVGFAYPGDGGDFAGAVRRCVGVAKCRETTAGGAGVMCPSYRVTREERHSTRGRARLLHEMLAGGRGGVITDGWRSEEVREALDLCLSCKGCRSDCPVGVDMATYKAEFLHHHYAGRVRPAAHYSMGWLPVWLRAAAPAARVLGPLARVRPVAALVKRLGGIAPERELPELAGETFTRWWARRGAVRRRSGWAELSETGGSGHRAPDGLKSARPALEDIREGAGRGEGPAQRHPTPPHPDPAPRPGDRPTLLLWPDTFTTYLSPEAGRAAVAVLEDAGLRVVVPPRRPCCGLTWISTGQLGRARTVLRRTLDTLAPALAAGLPVVVLEPSCAAALRTDLPELLPGDPRARELAASVRTFAQAVEEFAPDWEPPWIGRPAVGQTHCHQHAVLGDAAERRLRERAGLDGELSGGCCGLAGDFGFARGHYEVSVACAEERLLPALRAAPAGAEVLADGFSCRTQVAQLGGGGGPRARHLAEVLAEGLGRATTLP